MDRATSSFVTIIVNTEYLNHSINIPYSILQYRHTDKISELSPVTKLRMEVSSIENLNPLLALKAHIVSQNRLALH